MISAKENIDKEFEDLDKTNKNLKKNIELDLLNKNLMGTSSLGTPSLSCALNCCISLVATSCSILPLNSTLITCLNCLLLYKSLTLLISMSYTWRWCIFSLSSSSCSNYFETLSANADFNLSESENLNSCLTSFLKIVCSICSD